MYAATGEDIHGASRNVDGVQYDRDGGNNAGDVSSERIYALNPMDLYGEMLDNESEDKGDTESAGSENDRKLKEVAVWKKAEVVLDPVRADSSAVGSTSIKERTLAGRAIIAGRISKLRASEVGTRPNAGHRSVLRPRSGDFSIHTVSLCDLIDPD